MIERNPSRSGTIPVALFGATGYAGREAARLLASHPAFRLAAAFGGRDREGAPLSSIHPSLRGVVDLPCGAIDAPGGMEAAAAAARACGADLALLATPEDVSLALAPALLRAGARVVDLSGAFRLQSPESFAAWYGRGHARPDLLGRAAYGLPEWADGALSRADLVANPGCYPTAALLALLPLRRADLIDLSAPVVIQAISGASGAGRRLREDLLFCEVEGSVRPYGLPRHRHLGEIAERAGLAPGIEVLFLPHLAPIERGLLCTIALRLRAGFDTAAVAQTFARAYALAPFVRLLGEGAAPSTGDVRWTNSCALGWHLVPATRQLVVISAIDNLVKGAAGQAIQNLNLMAGRPQEEGLAR
jgi:N-acetyl-gamma-glutamyl-phosphate reductase